MIVPYIYIYTSQNYFAGFVRPLKIQPEFLQVGGYGCHKTALTSLMHPWLVGKLPENFSTTPVKMITSMLAGGCPNDFWAGEVLYL